MEGYNFFANINYLVNYFSRSDFFNILSITISFIAILTAYKIYIKTFRPIIYVEIRNVLFKPSLSTYELCISNNGNVIAKDIKIEYDKKSLDLALNHDCISKKDDDLMNSFNFIKESLSKEIKYIAIGKEKKGLFLILERDELGNIIENSCPLKLDTPIKLKLSYRNNTTRKKYKETVYIEFKYSNWVTDYNMTDELGYDLSRIIKELKEISKSTKNNNFKDSLTEMKNLEQSQEIFSKFNKKEKNELILLLVQNTDNHGFYTKLEQKAAKSNSSINKKIDVLLSQNKRVKTLFLIHLERYDKKLKNVKAN